MCQVKLHFQMRTKSAQKKDYIWWSYWPEWSSIIMVIQVDSVSICFFCFHLCNDSSINDNRYIFFVDSFFASTSFVTKVLALIRQKQVVSLVVTKLYVDIDASTSALVLMRHFLVWIVYREFIVDPASIIKALQPKLMHPRKFCIPKLNLDWLNCTSNTSIAAQPHVLSGGILKWSHIFILNAFCFFFIIRIIYGIILEHNQY